MVKVYLTKHLVVHTEKRHVIVEFVRNHLQKTSNLPIICLSTVEINIIAVIIVSFRFLLNVPVNNFQSCRVGATTS